jgi:hypothetical protein
VNGVKIRNAGLLALAFAVLSVREAASQQTPQAEPTWTPSAECQRVEKEYEASAKSGKAMSPEQYWLDDACLQEAKRHRPQYYRPESGPLIGADVPTIKRVFPLPTPDASP